MKGKYQSFDACVRAGKRMSDARCAYERFRY